MNFELNDLMVGDLGGGQVTHTTWCQNNSACGSTCTGTGPSMVQGGYTEI